MSQRSGGIPPQTPRHRMLDGETRDSHCCTSPADTVNTVQSYCRARQIQTPAETVMPSVLASVRKQNITTIEKQVFLFSFLNLPLGRLHQKAL